MVNMRVFLFVIALAAVVSSELIIVRKGNDNLWNEYKNYFKKNYSPEDDGIRRSNFDKLISEIFDHNMGFHNGKHSYSMGLNHLSDLVDVEFKDASTGLDEKVACNNKSMVYAPPSDVQIPESIDWNERGYVTKVMNQGSCGACWAFCATAALEGQHKRMTGNLVKLSEQHLVDCSTVTGNNKCKGGQMCRAYEYATMIEGVNTESYYPYEDKAGNCRYSPKHVGSQVKGYLEIPFGDEQALLLAVALIGPVAAGLDGMQPSFRHYKSGIYDDSRCSNSSLNHAVTIVGYGTEKGKDYWLVKNSWGPHWGDNGFGKIVRNKNNQCGLASSANFPVLSANEDGQPILDGPKAT